MTRARLLFGLACAVAVGSVVMFAVRKFRRRLVPGFSGLEGLLADVILALSVITVVADALGAVGWFKPWPLAVALIFVSSALTFAGRAATSSDRKIDASVESQTGGQAVSDRVADEPFWAGWLVAAGVGAVAALWIRLIPQAIRIGPGSSDSLWYHMPMMADFVRSGSFLGLHLYSADIAVSTYPAGYEVFGSVLILIAGSDVLLPFMNLAWAVLLLAAAHSFGRRFGVPHLVVLGALIFLAMPVSVLTMSANAMNEVMALALLIAGLAFAVRRGTGSNVGRLFLVGLSAGLVASVKFAMLGPAVVLVVAALVIELRAQRTHVTGRRERPRTSGAGSFDWHRLGRSLFPLLIGTLATGAFWYVRNVFRFGSPIPEIHVGIGGFSLGHVEVVGTTGPMLPTLVSGLRNATEAPFLTFALGPLWWLILSAPVLILGLLVGKRDWELKVLSVASATMFAMGLFTPQYVVDGIYQDIQWNTRYLMAGLCSALIVGLAALRHGRGWTIGMVVTMGVLATGVVYSVANPESYLWMDNGPIPRDLRWPAVSIAVALVVFGLVRWRGDHSKIVWSTLIAGVTSAVLAVLVLHIPSVFEGRYQAVGRAPGLYAWAQTHGGRRIAVAPNDIVEGITAIARNDPDLASRGALSMTYPLLGPNLSNKAEPIARFNGTRVARPTTCGQWWDQIRAMDATNVLIWEPPRGDTPLPGLAWTERSPESKLIIRAPIDQHPSTHLLLYAVDSAAPSPC